MMGLINQCRCTQSWVFALSNSGTGLETQATSPAISQSCTETLSRTEILLAHFIHIMYMLFCQASYMETETRTYTEFSYSSILVFWTLDCIVKVQMVRYVGHIQRISFDFRAEIATRPRSWVKRFHTLSSH